MKAIDFEIKYFQNLAERASSIRWKKFEPFKIIIKVGAPVCITSPWISFDGLLSHLILMDSFGQDIFITPKKLNLAPFLPKGKRPLPLKKTHDIYHCSVSRFVPEGNVKVTQIYKRFEDKYARNLDKKKIYLGSGKYRSYILKEPYIPCQQVVFYVCGDMEIIRKFIEEYLVGIGNDYRIGFGAVRDIQFEKLGEDWSIVANGVAMRPIPVEMCEEYEDAAYLAYRAPYWDPKNVVLCVPPGARCKLKNEYERSFAKMGKHG